VDWSKGEVGATGQPDHRPAVQIACPASRGEQIDWVAKYPISSSGSPLCRITSAGYVQKAMSGRLASSIAIRRRAGCRSVTYDKAAKRERHGRMSFHKNSSGA